MFFKEIIGQEKIKRQLIQTVKDGRISHAQLFLGAEGSGKLALAIAYAQYISCEDKSDSDSCGKCSSCIKYNKLVHPDLHFAFPVATTSQVKDKPISAKFLTQWREAVLKNPYMNLFQWLQHIGIENKQGSISVNESNEIIKKLGLKPYESEFKVMIIWMPEKMNDSAANKLLKILEEPSHKTLFTLVAEDQGQIINTILSRTQIVKINKISDEDLTKAIVERYNISTNEANSIAPLAEGSFLEAQRIMNESEENFNHDNFAKWMRLCYQKRVSEIIEWVDIMAKIGRERQKNYLTYCLHIFRESMIINYGDNSLVRLKGEELAFAKKFAPFINHSNVIQLTKVFNDACFHIERNAYQKILFLDISLKTMELLKK